MLQTRLCLVWCILHIFGLCTVSGISLDMTPVTVALGYASPSKTSMECSNRNANDMKSITLISLSKVSANGEQQVFATAIGSGPTGLSFKDTAPASLIKVPEVWLSGGIVDRYTPEDSFLKVEFDTITMQCEDAGTYLCSFMYIANDNTVKHVETTRNLLMYAPPSDLELTASRPGMVYQSIMGTIHTPYEMNINETISFSCNVKIGSERTKRVLWKMSSRVTDNTDAFNPYDPMMKNDGTASSTPVDCRYSRTATMSYTTTLFDAIRQNYLAFKCFMNVDPPGQPQSETESSTFYIKVLGGTEDPGNPDASSDGVGGSEGTTGNPDGSLDGVGGSEGITGNPDGSLDGVGGTEGIGNPSASSDGVGGSEGTGNPDAS